jgi:hypothetical protein
MSKSMSTRRCWSEPASGETGRLTAATVTGAAASVFPPLGSGVVGEAAIWGAALFAASSSDHVGPAAVTAKAQIKAARTPARWLLAIDRRRPEQASRNRAMAASPRILRRPQLHDARFVRVSYKRTVKCAQEFLENQLCVAA